MREVMEKLWRAGKYAAVAIVVLSTLPVLIPSVFVLSVLLFTFVLPLLCAVAGFLYLQRHATMLYRCLPGASSRLSGADPSHRRLPPSSRSGGFTRLELFSKDADQIDTFETVDQEFDAVLVSTIPKFEKAMPETSPRAEFAKQVESGKEEGSELQRGEAAQRITSGGNSSESGEFQRTSADRDGCHEEAFARGSRQEGNEEEFRNSEEMSVSDDKLRKNIATLGPPSGNLEQDNREGQFVGTVPSNSSAYKLYNDEKKNAQKVAYDTDSRVVTGEKGQVRGEYLGAIPTSNAYNTLSKADGEDEKEHRGPAEASFSECQRDRDVNLIASCTKSGEGVEDVQGLEEEKKNSSNVTDRDRHEDELATVSEYSMENITSEDTFEGHPEVVPTERDMSGLNPVSSSGASRPESAPLDYESLEISRPYESASDHECFESTPDASFEAPQLEKESDFEGEEDNHSVRWQSTRGVESFDGDDDRDDSSLSDEDIDYYEVHSEPPQKANRGDEEITQAPETVLQKEESRSTLSCPAEKISGYPSTTSRESDALEEKEGMIRSSRSALAFSEDMYDSEEQLHLQQVHDEEERQLREELKAIKSIVGDDEATGSSLVSDIEELSQILGIELPSVSDDIPDLEWAKVAVEVMKVVVGVD